MPASETDLDERTRLAIRRFLSAMDQLEAAADRRAENQRVADNLKEELAVMQDDRARLAAELDGALHRNNTLAVASDDVKQRLNNVTATIRAILSQYKGG